MNMKRTSLEVIAPSVEEAIEKGLAELGLTREAVEVEVLDEGARGLFGLGARQSRIRLKIVSSTSSTGKPDTDWVGEAEPNQEKPESTLEVEIEPVLASEDGDQVLSVASSTVQELISKMKVSARVTARYIEPEEPHNRTSVLIEVHGDDLSMLIGRHAETLNALQYISNLIIGKELGRSFPIQIDVEGYRLRRERQLRQLARRMADQAMKTGRRQVLEPMPANERRIVHLELRDHPQVTTESIGEEPRRKVTILLK